MRADRPGVGLALLSAAPASATAPPWDDCSYESTRCVDLAD